MLLIAAFRRRGSTPIARDADGIDKNSGFLHEVVTK
jgi:hypothetical protein